jgi:aminomethyltransferase
VLICRTGYTGERGVELCCADEDAIALWDAVLARGAVPCGLGARDTLRLEVCYPLHGNDITQDTDAVSAGLSWTCAFDTEFTGVDVLRRIREEGPTRKLVAFVMEEKAIPRHGMPIEGGGEVTSGTHSPMLDQGIGMGYVPAASASPGTELAVDVRGKSRRASVVKKPIYRPKED